MFDTKLALTVDTPDLDGSLSWNALESLMVAMSHQLPAQALAMALGDAQERLVEAACGPRWMPVRGLVAPFACTGCQVREDFARKGRRTRPRKLHTAVGTVELTVWHVGCRGCKKVFSPLLVMLGLSGKRRTDRLTLDLAELGTQMSFARSAALDRQLAGSTATAGQAHNAMADTAALLTGAGSHEPDGPDKPDGPDEHDGPDGSPEGRGSQEPDPSAVADAGAVVGVGSGRHPAAHPAPPAPGFT